MIDEDFNRTWGRLDQPATTRRDQARPGRAGPLVERADFLLDLHSMHDDCVPLMLCGPLDRGAELAKTARRTGRHRARLGAMPPACACATTAASAIPRAARTALLIETGQHWRASSVVVAKDVAPRFLAETGVVEAADLPADWKQPAPPSQRVVQGDPRHRHQARQLLAGAALRGPGGDRQGGHRAGPRRRRAGDDALRRPRAGDARGQLGRCAPASRLFVWVG